VRADGLTPGLSQPCGGFLAGLVEIVLVLGVGTAMPDHLVIARAELGDHLRAQNEQ
jgi:hypothetical protein